MSPKPTPDRQRLEDYWRSKLEQAQLHYKEATAAYRILLKEVPEGSFPAPESAIAIARQAESEALGEYTRVLRVFNELVIHGRPPEEQAKPDLVVVIDDDKSVRNSLRTLLRSAEYRVAAFESAEEFLASEAATETGCLILDVRMPGIGGLELQVRLHDRNSELPIIFITGHDDGTLRQQAIQAGAVDLLHKPFPPKALLSTVQAALGRRMTQRGTAGA
jgi:CheY-like chemotaxis protein